MLLYFDSAHLLSPPFLQLLLMLLLTYLLNYGTFVPSCSFEILCALALHLVNALLSSPPLSSSPSIPPLPTLSVILPSYPPTYQAEQYRLLDIGHSYHITYDKSPRQQNTNPSSPIATHFRFRFLSLSVFSIFNSTSSLLSLPSFLSLLRPSPPASISTTLISLQSYSS